VSALNMADRLDALKWFGLYCGILALYARHIARRARRARRSGHSAVMRELHRHEVQR